MARYVTATFTTASVAENGGVLNHDLTIASNVIDISRIKITPSIAAGENAVEIYIHSSRSEGQLLYREVFTAAEYNDPADETGAEFKQGWIVPYYDTEEDLTLYLKFTNNHSAAKTYDVEIDYEYLSDEEAGVVGSPDGLAAWAYANGLDITSFVTALRNNSDITEAEFRAKRVDVGLIDNPQDLRLVSEGGAFVPDGTDNLRITSISAGPDGANYEWTSGSAGRWYFAWRLKNSIGWSRWTDGHTTPRRVIQWVDTNELTDTGPPADWEVWLEDGPQVNTVVVHATRPRTNGRNLLWWLVQVKDASTGSWLALDNGTSPSQVKYNGSSVAHTLSADHKTLSKAASGWGTAAVGDLILLDVRGGNFDVNYCQWALVESIGSTTLTFASPKFRPQTLSDLRVKIVAPPSTWSTSGYLGAEPNNGMWPSAHDVHRPGEDPSWLGGDYFSEEFVSPPIAIPSGVTNPEARVWFENIYSRSDGSLTHSTGKGGGSGVWVAPRTFTTFNQADHWVPVYPPSSWGTLAISSAGKVTMATKTSASDHQGSCGMRARFRIYPDSTGQFQVYAKWTNVTIPVSPAIGDILGLGIVLQGGRLSDHQCTGVSIATKDGSATYLVFDALYNEPRATPESTGPSFGNIIVYSRSPNYTRFSANSTVELRCTCQARTWYGSRILVIDPIEIRVGGGGWATDRTSYPREGIGLGVYGMEIFLGWIGNCRVTGATAILDTFSLLKGIAEVY